MYSTRNDLPLATRKKIIALLSPLLADGVDAKTQVKQAHWNVHGPQFIALHELFDTVAGVVEDGVDMIAERIVQLGGVALGTARVAAKASRLKEYPLDISEGPQHVAAVADALAAVSKAARKGIDAAAEAGDTVTSDMLTEVARELDKQLWFVEAHLQVSK